MTVAIDVKCEGGSGCVNRALYAVRVHQLDACQDYADTDGQRLFTLCAGCTKKVGRNVADLIANIATASGGEPVLCHICEKDLSSLHDAFEVESL